MPPHPAGRPGSSSSPYFQVTEQPRLAETSPFAALLHQQPEQVSLEEGGVDLLKAVSLSSREGLSSLKKVEVGWIGVRWPQGHDNRWP